MLGMIGQAFLDYNLAYLIMFPQFICMDAQGQTEVCESDYICEDNLEQYSSASDVQPGGYYINYEDPFSLHNWV